MRHSFWFKILVFIIIQALLLTQVDFSLAAVYQNKQSFQKIALTLEKISDKRVSFFALTNLNSCQLDIKTVLSILKSFNCPIDGLISNSKVQEINNRIYKVFTVFNKEIKDSRILLGFLRVNEDTRKRIAKNKTQKSTAPPIANIIRNKNFYNRTV